jgi:hydrogenase maturation factor
LHAPGISVVKPALLAAASAKVHCMHDPTEGGVITGLAEIARAAGTGLEVDLDAIPVLEEGRVLCAEFGLDPLGTIASGSVLMSAPPGSVDTLRSALAVAGYPLAVIGKVTEPGGPLLARRGGHPVPWPAFPVDEIARIF